MILVSPRWSSITYDEVSGLAVVDWKPGPDRDGSNLMYELEREHVACVNESPGPALYARRRVDAGRRFTFRTLLTSYKELGLLLPDHEYRYRARACRISSKRLVL